MSGRRLLYVAMGYDWLSARYPSARCVIFKEFFSCKGSSKIGDSEINLCFFILTHKIFRKSRLKPSERHCRITGIPRPCPGYRIGEGKCFANTDGGRASRDPATALSNGKIWQLLFSQEIIFQIECDKQKAKRVNRYKAKRYLLFHKRVDLGYVLCCKVNTVCVPI